MTGNKSGEDKRPRGKFSSGKTIVLGSTEIH